MIKSFLRFTFWFFVIILAGLGALSITSMASPYLDGVKAAALEVLK